MSKEKKLFALCFSFAFLAAGPMAAQAGGTPGGGKAASQEGVPVLFVPEISLDAGEVVQGEVLSLEYTISNRGSKPLTVDARPSCGCTVAEYDRTIEPGADGLLRARIDTAGFAGPVTKSILLKTNDPESPTKSLSARFEVRPVLELLPRPMVRLGKAGAADASATVVLQATDANEGDFKVIGLEPAQPYVKATAHRLEGSSSGSKAPARYEIRVALADDAPKGFVNVPVTIRTDHPKAASVQLRVVGTVTDS